ncbi:MAG: radical SAM family heme chaperone HemW [Eubacteriales bacterium]|nr:radical SAM family heme chaperone HemW [Eubacteriales bacterium]
MSDASVYVHIPFCKSRCAYCDFTSFTSIGMISDYTSALIREIKKASETQSRLRVPTVFIGGGTPSLLLPEQLIQIFEALRSGFEIDENAEITIEANPGTLSESFLKAAKDCGVNRISMGVQAWQPRLLEILGRIHRQKEVTESADLLSKLGFDNWNADLMMGLPTQTTDELFESIDVMKTLGAKHLSCYSLILEDGTRLFGDVRSGKYRMQTDEQDREMYRSMTEYMGKLGYHQYEISNFAYPDMECRHNLIYWRRKPYIGFGCAAASQVGNRRYKNTASLADYISDVSAHCEEETISVREAEKEAVMLSLRLREGITDEKLLKKLAPYTKPLTDGGFMEHSGKALRLTKTGMDVMDEIIVRLWEGLDAIS